MLVQQPPLHPVFAPPQRPSHECRVVEHALSAAQSAATLQPHAPFTHAVPFDADVHDTHAAPFVPHAGPARPDTHVPFEQHPLWQGWLTLHAVVHVDPLHA
jgi:hypothetical protein